jgi:energy-coupling factor transporter ATP-binding protein EcfA2
MAIQLTRFRVERLHGFRTIDVQITDNKLVLVGENGTGKSTIANMIYYFLTQQWTRLATYSYQKIVASFGGKEFVLNSFPKPVQELLRVGVADERLFFQEPEGVSDREFFRLLRNQVMHSRETSPADTRSYREIERALAAYDSLVDSGNKSLDRELKEIRDQLNRIRKEIGELSDSQVLYLPTYRRIEQDLESILPSLRSEMDSREYRIMQRRIDDSARSRRLGKNIGFVEMVEFGMNDVEAARQTKMKKLDSDRRIGLDKLTGVYLRDVIQREYKTPRTREVVEELDQATVDAILDRIPKDVLTTEAKEQLRLSIVRLRESVDTDVEDLVTIMYLVRLRELHKSQQAEEREVRQFVDICNGYLTGKRLVFDDINFELPLMQTEGEEKELKLSMLSSGEKQIVSLFSHIYLSGIQEFFVVIDEPELSLSVPWQKRFLMDIVSSGRCSGLIAVTHSPFIYDNELDGYAHSIEEFVEVV